MLPSVTAVTDDASLPLTKIWSGARVGVGAGVGVLVGVAVGTGVFVGVAVGTGVLVGVGVGVGSTIDTW
jgi:hypothetical protein